MPLYGYRTTSGQPGRHRNMRWIIAAVIAVIALIGYFSNTQVNPITGEKQRVGNLTPSDEVVLGYNALPELVQQMGGKVPEDHPLAQHVSAIGNQLLANSKLSETEYKFTFTLLNDPKTVNAFALPGGPVFITRALYDRLENEAQLAGVVGHEIGHVVHRHGAQRMAKGSLAQMLSVAVGVGASGEGDSGQLAAAAAAMAGQIILMKYSREDELESDDQGLSYLVNAGYDPREMVRVMEILRDATSEGGGQRPPDFMASHPHPEDRIAGIKRFVESKFPSGVPPSLEKGRPLRNLNLTEQPVER